MKIVRALLPPVLAFILLFAAMEIFVRGMRIKPYLLPPPSRVFRTALVSADLWQALGRTAGAAAIGFAISAALGMMAAIVLSSSRWVQRAFYPYAVFFQTVPIIAIAPLLVIWFGYGMNAIVVSAIIVSIFPVIANTLTGLLSVDPALRDLFRLYGAGGATTLVKLSLPSALPSIFTGLRIASGLAVIGAIVGEFIGGGGIGDAVQVSIREGRTDKVLAAVLLASLLGLLMFGIINLASYASLRHWHASEQT